MEVVVKVEKEKQRLQGELLSLSSEQGDMSIKFNKEVATSAELRLEARKAEQALEVEIGRRSKAAEEAAALKAALATMASELEDAQAAAAAAKTTQDAVKAQANAAADKAAELDPRILVDMPPSAAPEAGSPVARSAVELAEEARKELSACRLELTRAKEDQKVAEEAAEAFVRELDTLKAKLRTAEERASEAMILEAEVGRLRRVLGADGEETDDDDDEGEEGAEKKVKGRAGSFKVALEEVAAVRAEAAEAQAQAATALDKATSDAAFYQSELEGVRSQLVEALASAERAASDARLFEGQVKQLSQRVQAAEGSSGGGGSKEEEENAELVELRVELVESKIKSAEAMFQVEEYRGKNRRLQKQLDRLGGSQLEVAQHSTKMEVRLAQALSENKRLVTENEKLAKDVSGMIELKLQLAEAKAS